MTMATATQFIDRASLRALRKRSDFKGAWMVLHAWGLVFGSMAVFAAWPNPATFLLAVLIIGARQLGLAGART
ncbi:MAG: fatty acid desaturase, partial [Alphaproteobacteria bacterium]|nr:fatty acid desaturase [Alphaproteobacteria bacterium]